MIRGLGGSGAVGPQGKKKREEGLRVYTVKKILEGLELDSAEFIEVSILCGTDFTNNVKIKGIGPGTALKKIRELKTVEAIVHKMSDKDRKEKVPKEFKPVDARKVFYRYLYMDEIPEGLKWPEEIPPYNHLRVCSVLKSKITQYQNFAIKWTTALTGKNPGYLSQDEIPDIDALPSFKQVTNAQNSTQITDQVESLPENNDKISNQCSVESENVETETINAEQPAFEIESSNINSNMETESVNQPSLETENVNQSSLEHSNLEQSSNDSNFAKDEPKILDQTLIIETKN
jgi:5'-3' exonuclease